MSLDYAADAADDAEMEAFYASLDAGTHAQTEETKEALKIVQDFMTNSDASILLDQEQCSVMKTSLDYLLNLTAAGDGLSEETRASVSEASRVFTHCSREYTEASMKIGSTTSELLRADELEAELEDNKKRFEGVVAFEKANISGSQLEQNTTRKRKREIFKEGKKLKTQMDELKDKVPHLQHEQDLAKERQAKIKLEWSEVGEKFKKNVVE